MIVYTLAIIMMVFGIAENRYLLVKVNREKNILNINEHAVEKVVKGKKDDFEII